MPTEAERISAELARLERELLCGDRVYETDLATVRHEGLGRFHTMSVRQAASRCPPLDAMNTAGPAPARVETGPPWTATVLPPLAVFTVASLALIMGAVALSRRWPHLRRTLPLSLALLPAAAGLWLSSDVLVSLDASLQAPTFGLPRREMLAIGLTEAQPPLLAGLALSAALVVLVWWLSRQRGAASSSSRAAWLLPASILAALGLGAVARQQQVHEIERALETPWSALQAPAAPRLATLAGPSLRTQEDLDLPLVLVSADGTLRYDDTRGRQPPTSSALLLPRPRADEDDRLPSLLWLAVDERTPFVLLRGALTPLAVRGTSHFLFVFARTSPWHTAEDLTSLHVPVRPLLSRPVPSTRALRPLWRQPTHPHRASARVPHILFAPEGLWLRPPSWPDDCEGDDLCHLLEGNVLEKTPGAEPPEPVLVGRGPVDEAELRAAARRWKETSPDLADEGSLQILPAEDTPFAEIAAVLRAVRADERGPLFPDVALDLTR